MSPERTFEEMSVGGILEQAKESQAQDVKKPAPSDESIDAEEAAREDPRAYGTAMGTKMLSEIAKGGLADALSVEFLQNLHKIVFVPDKKERQGMYAIRDILRGGGPQPGVIRTGRTTTSAQTFSEAEITAMREHGLHFRAIPRTKFGVMEYLPAKEVAPGLQTLVIETKQALRDPGTDPVELAARFKQRFIALHPFQDGNGRVGRLMVDRILAEYGIPPPLLENPKMDVTLSHREYVEVLRRGIKLARDRTTVLPLPANSALNAASP